MTPDELKKLEATIAASFIRSDVPSELAEILAASVRIHVMKALEKSATADLLEALADALKTADIERHEYRPWHSKARAAIIKATGKDDIMKNIPPNCGFATALNEYLDAKQGWDLACKRHMKGGRGCFFEGSEVSAMTAASHNLENALREVIAEATGKDAA